MTAREKAISIAVRLEPTEHGLFDPVRRYALYAEQMLDIGIIVELGSVTEEKEAMRKLKRLGIDS